MPRLLPLARLVLVGFSLLCGAYGGSAQSPGTPQHAATPKNPGTPQNAATPQNPGTPAPPNILLIIVDDLGFADLACQGSDDMQTPNVDALFADSLRLGRLYANCPVCSPTRASVLTGCYPDRVGVPGVIRTHESNNWGYFSPLSRTLSEQLGDLGYRTAAIGKWHLGLEPENHPQSRGFDFFHGFLGDMMDDYYHHRRHDINYMRRGTEQITPDGHATDLFSQWAMDYVTADAAQQKPWFLYLAYNAPHTPIQPPADWLQKVKQRQPGINDSRAALVALIEHLDAGIGRVITALRQSGQYDDTVIVFTSDNGGQVNVGANNGSLRDGKGSMYEGGLRIPGAIRVPGRTAAGSATTATCATMDFFPTLVELAGGTVNGSIDGRSLVPLLANPTTHWPDRELYFVRREGGNAYAGLTIEAVLSGQHKLVHNFPTQQFELFDLANDPSEQIDLSQKQPQHYREMIGRLQQHLQRGGQVPWQKQPQPQ